MTLERAIDQANIEVRQDGKTRFVLQEIAYPENFLITKWYTIRRGWKRHAKIDPRKETPNE
jgi:hypothetical protein